MFVAPARFVLVTALALGVSCVSPPASAPTQTNDARNHDAWFDGAAACTAGTSDDLRVEDVVVGAGRVIDPADTVRVHYLAVDAASGKKIHDSRDDGPPVEIVAAGNTKTLCGLEKSLVGMHAGGQRRVMVPARLAFGDAGRPPDIAPNTDLLVTVDVFLRQDISAPGPAGSPPQNPARGGGGGRRR